MLELLGEPLDLVLARANNSAVELGSLETRVLDAISFSGSTFDQLLIETGLSANETQLALASLELGQLVERRLALWRKR